MRIPEYWAEGRARSRTRDRQVTIRRWGWSDESQADAQRHADGRAAEALQRVLAGENRPRREPKVAYNGAEGVPIREEIVARHGPAIVTRNAYGALCLNTPDVLFADVDFRVDPGCLPGCLGATAGAAAATGAAYPFGVAAATAAFFVGFAAGGAAPYWLMAALRRLAGGHEQIAWRRLHRFLRRRPEWSVRAYRTPAGLRLLATHALFDPTGAEAEEFFRAIGVDPVYHAMCRRQACFRARVSPKPWRVGVADHMTPRSVWPIPPERLPERRTWIDRYTAAADGFAACRYVETLGSGVATPSALEVQRLHDEMSKADSGLPIA